MNNKKDEEIKKAFLEWLFSKKYDLTAEQFMKETNLTKEDATKDNVLDKKWGSLISYQRKITKLEADVKQLKKDLENGGGGAASLSNQAGDSMGLPKSVEKAVIKGHRQEVICLAFHPFYKRLASGSEDASIMIWECDEFTQEKTLRAHSGAVNNICFDLSGKYLASCSNDLTIKIWIFDTMTSYKTLSGHEHTVSSIEFMPDGNFLFSASRDKTIRYWDINSGNCKQTFTGHTEWVRSVSVNLKGILMASSSDDQNIIIWTIDIGAQVTTLSGHDNKIDGVLFLKNDKSIGNVYTSDYLSNFKSTSSITSQFEDKEDLAKINEKIIEKAKISKGKEVVNKDYVVSYARDKTAKLWDVTAGICIFTFAGHDGWVTGATEHPNGKYIITCSEDKSVRIWDLKTGMCSKKLMDCHEKFVICVSISPKCKLLASGSNDKMIKVWDCS